MGKFINDIKCLAVQKAVYLSLYKGHKPNEWEPWKESKKTIYENGLICYNDIRYGNSFPNSFFDIWYPDDKKEKKPVVVYFHGGGFIFGDKTSGDPLSVNNGDVSKLLEIVKSGYILVNANYALAPKYRFPVQILQIDELFKYLLTHDEELNIDMNHVCLAGSSAGAIMTEIYATCVCNQDYAQRFDLNPIMSSDKLKVLAIDEAALDASTFNKNMYAMLGCVSGTRKNSPDSDIAIINAKKYITDKYIPTWINASNEGGENGPFAVEAKGVKAKLDAIGCPCTMIYFPDENLPHGYMDQLSTNEFAKQAFNSMMTFIKKYI